MGNIKCAKLFAGAASISPFGHASYQSRRGGFEVKILFRQLPVAGGARLSSLIPRLRAARCWFGVVLKWRLNFGLTEACRRPTHRGANLQLGEAGPRGGGGGRDQGSGSMSRTDGCRKARPGRALIRFGPPLNFPTGVDIRLSLRDTSCFYAQVVELADTPRSGRGAFTVMRVSSPALSTTSLRSFGRAFSPCGCSGSPRRGGRFLSLRSEQVPP